MIEKLTKKAEEELKPLIKEGDTLKITLTKKTVLNCCTQFISRVLINEVSVLRYDIHRTALYDKTEEETIEELLETLVKEYKKQLEEDEQT